MTALRQRMLKPFLTSVSVSGSRSKSIGTCTILDGSRPAATNLRRFSRDVARSAVKACSQNHHLAGTLTDSGRYPVVDEASTSDARRACTWPAAINETGDHRPQQLEPRQRHDFSNSSREHGRREGVAQQAARGGACAFECSKKS